MAGCEGVTGGDFGMNTPSKPSDLKVRVLSAIVMVLVAGGAFWLGGVAFNLFVLIIGFGLVFEWWGLISKISVTRFGRFFWMAGGLIYIGLASFMLNAMRVGLPMMNDAFDPHPFSSPLVMALALMPILIVIATDVGAYFAGRSLGGPKIAPSISPSKTWSGLAGGMLCAAGVAGLSAWYFGAPAGVGLVAALVGATLAIVAQAGDFFESWMKRRAGVKDSSRLIPGHGGLLDRLDGLLPVLIVSGGLEAAVGFWFWANFTT